MKRAAVFAHYDKDSIIDDYVIYYLKNLREVFDKIIFVSCCEIPSEELSKLDGLADFSICECHREYDFGSYKRGYFYLLNNGLLDKFDELAFINDSCFGPFFSLKQIFESISACDFWGVTRNLEIREHLQSYFLVFNKNVFTSQFFYDFMASIKEEKKKNHIINNYEIGLSKLLTENGFTFDYAVKHRKDYKANITIFKWREIIENYGMPFIKCSLLRGKNTFHTTILGWEELIPESYPIASIEKNVERTASKKITNRRFESLRIKTYGSISELPFRVRRIFQNIIKYCLPFLSD